MRIAAGIERDAALWRALLEREGLPVTTVDLATGEGLSACSVLILSRLLDDASRTHVAAYLRAGGALLAPAAFAAGLAGVTVRDAPLPYLIGDGGHAFPSVHLLDLDVRGRLPREANALRTPSGEHAVFAGPLGGGSAVLLPFDPVQVWTDPRAANRAFHARRDRLPAERVSRVARGELTGLLHDALVFLHHRRGLPYVHAWYFPETAANVMTFRIDTDGAPQRDVDALYEVLREAQVPGTWFLDVAAHETWLHHFAELEGQEMGVHCYRHRVDRDPELQAGEWRHALGLMHGAGLAPAGIAVPYGLWTPAIGAVIDGLGLGFSSEFSCGYDTLPFHPQTAAGPGRTLQIPIHPVSTGSLRRAGFTAEEMTAYFRRVIDGHMTRNIPLFFYHHPSHRLTGVIGALLAHARGYGIPAMSMGAYARWWQGRLRAVPTGFTFADGVVHVDGSDTLAAAGVGLRVVFPDGGESVVPAAAQVRCAAAVRNVRKVQPVPADLRVTREPDLRRLIGDLFAAFQRRMA